MTLLHEFQLKVVSHVSILVASNFMSYLLVSGLPLDVVAHMFSFCEFVDFITWAITPRRRSEEASRIRPFVSAYVHTLRVHPVGGMPSFEHFLPLHILDFHAHEHASVSALLHWLPNTPMRVTTLNIAVCPLIRMATLWEILDETNWPQDPHSLGTQNISLTCRVEGSPFERGVYSTMVAPIWVNLFRIDIQRRQWSYLDLLTLFHMLPMAGNVVVTIRGSLPSWRRTCNAIERGILNDFWDVEKRYESLHIFLYPSRPLSVNSLQRLQHQVAVLRVRVPVRRPRDNFQVAIYGLQV